MLESLVFVDRVIIFDEPTPINLINEIKPDIGRVVNSVTNGICVMPSFREILSEEEINAVAYYVSESSTN